MKFEVKDRFLNKSWGVFPSFDEAKAKCDEVEGCKVHGGRFLLHPVEETEAVQDSEEPTYKYMDYNMILDFWADGASGTWEELPSGEVVLCDLSDTWTERSKKEAALQCFESIKIWAEDDDDAMRFVENITFGEIMEKEIRFWLYEEPQTEELDTIEIFEKWVDLTDGDWRRVHSGSKEHYVFWNKADMMVFDSEHEAVSEITYAINEIERLRG